ncbi:MAG: glycogen synthase GlgA [Rhodothermales bacterium]|nr:glycogen synthase GlgA [Rhodothermales bacterium]
MNVCFITSECVPYAKTGGLADVSGALPKALAELGCAVKVFMPLYDSIDTRLHNLVFSEDLYEIPVQIGNRSVVFNTWFGNLGDSGVKVHFIDCPLYYHRSSIYTSDGDENERYILLQHAAFKIMQRYNWSPDVLHCNDWQSGLVPAMAKNIYHWDELFRESVSVLTVHNIAYQGAFDPQDIYKTGLPSSMVAKGGPLEHNGAMSFMKGGIVYADAVTSVSPTYAKEIQQPQYGAGLDAILRTYHHKLTGILNGIDTDVWSPGQDTYIKPRYTVKTLNKKQRVKANLLKKFGLEYDEERPLFGIISRLTPQKGFELLQPILSHLLQTSNMQLVVLGSGEESSEQFFQLAKDLYPEQVAVFVGYNNELAHWIEAGADFFIMPSRFEPCGLNQMYSLAYGTLPIVRKTGGLADTVIDVYSDPENGNGLVFEDFTSYALLTTIQRALEIYSDSDALETIRLRGMNADFSWTRSAEKYVALYNRLKYA